MKLLGTTATVSMKMRTTTTRYFNGFITRMQQGDRMGRYERFTATLQPWLWFAPRTVNSKVFQEKSVKEIVDRGARRLQRPTTQWRSSRLGCTRSSTTASSTRKATSISSAACSRTSASTISSSTPIEHAHDGADRRDGQAQEQAHQGPDQLGQHDEILVDGDQLARRPGGALGQDGGAPTSTTWPRPPRSRARAKAKETDRQARRSEGLRVHRPRCVQNSVKDEAQAQPSTDAVKQRARRCLIEELTALAAISHRHDQLPATSRSAPRSSSSRSRMQKASVNLPHRRARTTVSSSRTTRRSTT